MAQTEKIEMHLCFRSESQKFHFLIGPCRIFEGKKAADLFHIEGIAEFSPEDGLLMIAQLEEFKDPAGQERARIMRMLYENAMNAPNVWHTVSTEGQVFARASD